MAVESERLLELIRRRGQAWSARAWQSPAGSGGTRADAVFAAVTALADLAAETEGRPHRAVPRLGEVSLPDQLAVMVHDVLATNDDATVRRGEAILRELTVRVGIRA